MTDHDLDRQFREEVIDRLARIESAVEDYRDRMTKTETALKRLWGSLIVLVGGSTAAAPQLRDFVTHLIP
jgi:hypothetical protein